MTNLRDTSIDPKDHEAAVARYGAIDRQWRADRAAAEQRHDSAVDPRDREATRARYAAIDAAWQRDRAARGSAR